MCALALPVFAFLWEDIERAQRTTPINHKLRRKMKRGMEDEKKDGGRHRKQHLEKCRKTGEREEKWMNGWSSRWRSLL